MNSGRSLIKKIIHYIRLKINKPEITKSVVLNPYDKLISGLIMKPKTKKQVALDYGVSVRTLNRWLDEKNIYIPHGIICPKDLLIIYSTLGPPKI